MPRLHPDLLHHLPPTVARPAYDRRQLRAGIVHLGVGAFQRAHLADVNEAALHAGGALDWGIVGVSLRSPDTRDALAPQQGLYTLERREAGEGGRTHRAQRVIGCLLQVLVAPEDPAAVLARIAAPDTRIVSLTVTEKGYCHDPATGALQLDHPDIQHDLAQPEAPRGTLGFLVHGLARRRAHGLGGITLLSLDNLPANGHVLRGLVLAFAEQRDPALAHWIGTHCTFPCSMVDRIVPRTTDDDRTAIAQAIGLDDAWPVVGETFLDWVVEDRFTAGRPAWDAGGARFVAHAQPFETLKLRMVNGAHSALAYLGAVAGWTTVDQAMARPDLRRYVDALLQHEVAPTLPALPGLDLDAYRQRLLQRFANPALAHRTQQIAMDGSQKLPQRLLGTVRERLHKGQGIERLALAIAAWLHYLRGQDESGHAYAIHDPMSAALAQRAHEAHEASAGLPPEAASRAWTAHLVSFAPVFGPDLGANPVFVDSVAHALTQLRRDGVAATLARQPD
ncbi:MAG: Polyol:NADP oxidoreductase [Paracidovorax wautersii]|uniref:Polyol:NADP oxidoreductase n=1 Tax=Paracidovorax wautersii TaxID=1177982 RepID=A0A7V8JRM2_9BURK|nr:MAG: Polyol:NADP oxidoreductase [Paracidovorax wautersii]